MKKVRKAKRVKRDLKVVEGLAALLDEVAGHSIEPVIKRLRAFTLLITPLML
jgi:hypothetical protein